MSIQRLKWGYRVIKTKTDHNFKPLPEMVQYFLQNDEGKPISFWNDVPINIKSDTVTCGIQIPKQYQGKFEIIKELPYHPFMQDTRKNKFTNQVQLRYYAQFPLFNYGFIPQTWQQNIRPNSEGVMGDDDPLDICDLSIHPKTVGDIYEAKILGSFCLIDQGQIDWKILVIDAKQSQQYNIKDISDISERRIQSIKQWFRGIKVFDGKKQNTISYEGKIFGKDDSLKVIHEGYQEWKRLLRDPTQQYIKRRQNYFIV